MLDSLTWAGHVHTVGKVFPSCAVVVSLLLKHFVGLVTNGSGDVVGLCGTACWVNKDDTSRTDEGIVECTSEEFVVCAVDGVTALEGDDVNIVRECCTNLCRCLAWEIANRPT